MRTARPTFLHGTMNPWKLFQTFRAYHAGAPLGDVAVLKVDALVSGRAQVDDQLGAVCDEDMTTRDLATLRALPKGTLGREYARFLDANRITPLVIDPALRARFRDRPFVLRYTTTHDLHHVLAGFDASLAGEIGVLAFNIGQGAAPIGRAWLWLVRVVFMLLSPLEAGAIARNARLGLALGEHAQLVMAAPLASYFDDPLADVRRRLGILTTRSAQP
jgi:ubiquinone biosynthesis protein Coq4